MSREVHHNLRSRRSPTADVDGGKPSPLGMDTNVSTEEWSSPSSDEATADGDSLDRDRMEMVDRIMRSLCAALDSKLAAVKEVNPQPTAKQRMCMFCRKRKLKCDGIKPSCSTCSRRGHKCGYDEVRRKSGPKRRYVNAATSTGRIPFAAPAPWPPSGQESRDGSSNDRAGGNRAPVAEPILQWGPKRKKGGPPPTAASALNVQPSGNPPRASGERQEPGIRVASLAQTDEARVSVPNTAPGRATVQSFTTPYAHLVEEDMTEEEIRRLEEEDGAVPSRQGPEGRPPIVRFPFGRGSAVVMDADDGEAEKQKHEKPSPLPASGPIQQVEHSRMIEDGPQDEPLGIKRGILAAAGPGAHGGAALYRPRTDVSDLNTEVPDSGDQWRGHQHSGGQSMPDPHIARQREAASPPRAAASAPRVRGPRRAPRCFRPMSSADIIGHGEAAFPRPAAPARPGTATMRRSRSGHPLSLGDSSTREEERRASGDQDSASSHQRLKRGFYDSHDVQDSDDHDHLALSDKEIDRHHDDKHSSSPAIFDCLYKPCPYKSERESECKQHMEKAHGWTYVRAKGKKKYRKIGYSAAEAGMGDAMEQQGPTSPMTASPRAGDDIAGSPPSWTAGRGAQRSVNDDESVPSQPRVAVLKLDSYTPISLPHGASAINSTSTVIPRDFDEFIQPQGPKHSPAMSQGGLSTAANASSMSLAAQQLAAQWPLERVLPWLQANKFSRDWQETFRSLNIHGAEFLELGDTYDGGRGSVVLRGQVYPQLERECKKSGTEWDATKPREEGGRLRRLIGCIVAGKPVDLSKGYGGDNEGPVIDYGMAWSEEVTECGVLPMLTRTTIPPSVERGVEDGDGDGRRKKAKRGSSAAGVAGRILSAKFACPYFKRNPKKYRKWTSCPGPGWDEVHRVKTHLYRRHQLPIQCPRCWTVFSTDDQRQSHLQQDPPCAVQPNRTLHEGFTKDQEKRLRSRKKTHADMTDGAKWREIYMILFPDDDPSAIPSPYYDESDGEGESGGSNGSGELEDYATFIRREMPTLVRRELEVLFREEFRDVEERLRPRIAEIVLNLQPRLLSLYKQSQMPLSEYGPQQQGDTASGTEKTFTPSLSQGSGTGSGPASTPSTLPGTDCFLAAAETQLDWYGRNLDADWDSCVGSQVLAQAPAETDACLGLNWEHEFDKLLNHVLFVPPADIQTAQER